jgi:hypothetical protein
MMQMSFESYDSTPFRMGGMSYHEPARFGTPPIYLNVDGLEDPEDIRGMGLLALREVEFHEAREFWRVDHGDAPFHPHNRSGEAAWERVQRLRGRVSVRYPEPDGA